MTTTTDGSTLPGGLPRPEVTPPGPWALATPTSSTLPNGMGCHLVDVPGQHVVSVAVVLPLPITAEPREVEGVGAITTALLDEGTVSHPAEQFATLLERTGAAMGAGQRGAGVVVTLDVPARRLGPALDLLAEALREPAFETEDVTRLVRTRLAEIEQQHAVAASRASIELARTEFVDASRAARPLGGTAETVAAIDRAAVVAHHARLDPSLGHVVVAGDLSSVDAAALLSASVGAWQQTPSAPVPEPVAPQRRADRVRTVVVDRPGSVQSELLVSCPGPNRRTVDSWAPFPVLGYLVGGSPSARIDAVLREDKGYTYGIRAGFHSWSVDGGFVTRGSVRADSTVDAVRLLLGILEDAREGFSQDEAREGRDYVARTAPARYATADAVADEVADLLLTELPLDFPTRTVTEVTELTPEVLDAAWREWITGEWTLVVVGDAASIVDGLRELGRGEVTVVPA